jgi:dGTPase
MEMQVVDTVDGIAYMSADLEDALQGGYIDIEKAASMPVLKEVFYGKDIRRMDAKYVAGLISHHFFTLFVRETQERISAHGIRSIEDVQEADYYIADFGENSKKALGELRKFLMREYYEDEKVLSTVEGGKKMISDIFNHVLENPELIPKNFNPTVTDPVDRTCDFIAGMTDSYLREFWQDQIDKM